MGDMRDDMPAEVDFSNSMPNPYVGRVRRRVTINLDGDTVNYFKAESGRTGVPRSVRKGGQAPGVRLGARQMRPRPTLPELTPSS